MNKLRNYRQWLVWRYEKRSGQTKPTKVPYNVNTGRPAKVNAPSSWCTYDEASSCGKSEHYSGIGFVFTPDDPFLGIDIDDCRNPETGEIFPEAQSIIDAIASYTEISPSGTGVKIFLEASKSTGVKSKVHLSEGMALEVYDQSRYFTVTAMHLSGTPTDVQPRNEEYLQLEKQYLIRESGRVDKKTNSTPVTVSQYYHTKDDQEVIDTLRKGPDSDMFNRLFDKGDLSSFDNDHSKGDFGLCCLLAKECKGDKELIERIFSQSALSRGKWVNRPDYRDRTIEAALLESDDTYRTNKLESKLKYIWVLKDKIVELGINEGHFYIENRSKDRVYALADAKDRHLRQKVLMYLHKNKVLEGFRYIAYHGDASVLSDYYEFNWDTGILNVYISASPAKIEDNQLIEDYLQQMFGKHKHFIKQYLAGYAYNNFEPRLPTIVLFGPRGTSKSTFSRLVSGIFPSLQTPWDGMSKNFSPEAECKLAVIEENSTLNKDQYKLLKQYSGTSELRVNVKYIPEYNVRNNMNMILISNEEIPMYVEASELPTDERNNQFFMFRCTKVASKIDPLFEKKLLDRLGHYVRTELKRVFEATDYTQGRYGIPVPITKEERTIFQENRTRLEELSEELIAAIENELSEKQPTHNHYQNMLLSGFIATGFAKQVVGQDALSVLKHLAKKGVVGEADRASYDHKVYRGRYFKNMPDEIKQKLNNQL